MEAAKDVAAEFINGRPNDNIGITLFAGESFTQCPLTVDHAVLLDMIHNIKCGLIEDGTAAVSYTHLDVYKRQTENSSCRKERNNYCGGDYRTRASEGKSKTGKYDSAVARRKGDVYKRQR